MYIFNLIIFLFSINNEKLKITTKLYKLMKFFINFFKKKIGIVVFNF